MELMVKLTVVSQRCGVSAYMTYIKVNLEVRKRTHYGSDYVRKIRWTLESEC